MSAVATPELSSKSLEELFQEFQKLPDWNRFPLPEVYYQKFNIKKPQPQTVQESASFNPFVYMHFGEKPVETRGPVEGGVREIKDLMTLPVEVKMVEDVSGAVVNDDAGVTLVNPTEERPEFQEMDELPYFQELYNLKRWELHEEDEIGLVGLYGDAVDEETKKIWEERADRFERGEPDTEHTKNIVRRMLIIENSTKQSQQPLEKGEHDPELKKQLMAKLVDLKDKYYAKKSKD